jgi:hypothetical protein
MRQSSATRLVLSCRKFRRAPSVTSHDPQHNSPAFGSPLQQLRLFTTASADGIPMPGRACHSGSLLGRRLQWPPRQPSVTHMLRLSGRRVRQAPSVISQKKLHCTWHSTAAAAAVHDGICARHPAARSVSPCGRPLVTQHRRLKQALRLSSATRLMLLCRSVWRAPLVTSHYLQRNSPAFGKHLQPLQQCMTAFACGSRMPGPSHLLGGPWLQIAAISVPVARLLLSFRTARQAPSVTSHQPQRRSRAVSSHLQPLRQFMMAIVCGRPGINRLVLRAGPLCIEMQNTVAATAPVFCDRIAVAVQECWAGTLRPPAEFPCSRCSSL